MANDDDAEDELDDVREESLPAHWRPNTHVLDEIIEKHASAEAKKNQWMNRDKLRARAVEVSPDFVSTFFSSVFRRSVPATDLSYYHKEEGFPQYFQQWRHRALHEINADINELVIDTEQLRDAVSRYLKDSKWHSEYLDWYIVNTLTYAELYRTIEVVQNKLGGIFTTIMIRDDGAKAFFGYLLRAVYFLVKWAIWLVAVVFVNDAWEFPGVLLIIAATVAWQVHRWRARRKFDDLLTAMRNVYDVFCTQTFSWEVAWSELNRSREKGAVWPGELYKLVELRKSGK